MNWKEEEEGEGLSLLNRIDKTWNVLDICRQ